MVIFAFRKTDGMQYHLMGKEKTDHTYTDRIRPRVQKHDYQIAMFGGSEAQTCQLFNPKGNQSNHMILMRSRKKILEIIQTKDGIFEGI